MIPENLEGEEFKVVLHRVLAKGNYYVLGAQLVEDAAPKGIKLTALGIQKRSYGTEAFFLFSTINTISRTDLEVLVRACAVEVGFLVLGCEWHPHVIGRVTSGVVRLLWESLNGLEEGEGYVSEGVAEELNRLDLGGRVRIIRGY